MDRLVRIFILSACILHHAIGHDKVKRSIFSWSKETEVKDPAVIPGYLPPITVHKYNGVQINPVNGPSVYLPSSEVSQSSEGFSADQFQSSQLPPEYSSQLELLKNVVNFLPDDGRYQDYDVTGLLPYVDLISEDALARIQFAVEAEKSQKDSKLMKLVGFLRYLKELKLKPFKAAANFGVSLLNKKKETVSNLLHLGSSPAVSTPAPVQPPQIYPLPGGYPIHHPPTRPPHFVPSRPVIPSFPFVTPVIPSFPIQSPPLSDEGQQIQQQVDQQQQPAAPPSGVNSDNRVDPNLVHQVAHYPQITPAGTFLAYPYYPAVAPPRSDFREPPAYFSYPEQYQSPAPYQQAPKIDANAYPQEPHSSKSSNVPTYQASEQPSNFNFQNFAAQEKSKKYPLTPADTYATNDLAGSASDNFENIKESSEPAVETAVNRKEEQTAVKAENHLSESSSKSKVTKLRIIETRPPVVVFPETSAQSKPTDSESSSLTQPLATSSPVSQFST
ncbi:hypothetical protein V9T40_004226 [Parthenolecanium corni]|uniref:Uncharacterized protein n=1 Tax=Parthenolecanium corni TaxID=536013 RepID=A0AAN9U367_9HEMI